MSYGCLGNIIVNCWIGRFKMPERSIPKEAAFQIISDELMLDGNPRLNLASFVTTWMEEECDKLIMASVNKNYVDMDEYPVTTELQAFLSLLFLSINNCSSSLDLGLANDETNLVRFRHRGGGGWFLFFFSWKINKFSIYLVLKRTRSTWILTEE